MPQNNPNPSVLLKAFHYIAYTLGLIVILCFIMLVIMKAIGYYMIANCFLEVLAGRIVLGEDDLVDFDLARRVAAYYVYGGH